MATLTSILYLKQITTSAIGEERQNEKDSIHVADSLDTLLGNSTEQPT